ncbi:hypothetical protein CP532_2422 [Ophiocordyceps camponoti-leonardi (nom. inval.)]|nr:hypothetical protein CP532_2422 [Ophiocordyceps camponoti-leonardi (nom. inval.)]
MRGQMCTEVAGSLERAGIEGFSAVPLGREQLFVHDHEPVDAASADTPEPFDNSQRPRPILAPAPVTARPVCIADLWKLAVRSRQNEPRLSAVVASVPSSLSCLYDNDLFPERPLPATPTVVSMLTTQLFWRQAHRFLV